VTGMVTGAARRVAARAARGYVAGPTLGDARRTADALLDRGYGVTLAYWDADGESPTAVAEQHAWAIDDLARNGGDYLSVKAPSVGYDGGVAGALVTRARVDGVGLHFDSLDHGTTDRTLELLRSLPGGSVGVGMTVPGRWMRSPADAKRLAGEGVLVRVVKGQWPDPVAPDLDASMGFMDVVHALAGTPGPVRVATHDAGLVEAALDVLAEAGSSAELELLYGLPVRPVLQVAARLRRPVRVYVPYGHGWLPYALDGLKRSPRLMLRLVRDAFGGRYLGGFGDLNRR
jgi:proline dehydrogenase